MKPTIETDKYTLYLADCLEVMRDMPAGSVDIAIVDPGYGCNKAEWDSLFFGEWYQPAKKIANIVAIITGSEGLRDTIPLVGDDFIDVIAARNLNGMTRSAAGFSNWLASTIAFNKPKQGVTFFEFVVNGDMPDHPSPKPIDYMLKLVARITEPGQTILDCCMGSGTTLVAGLQLGRRVIGIETVPKYFDIAAKRIAQASLQYVMPTETQKQPKAIQLEMTGE